MAQAKRDNNYIPTLLGVSDADSTTPVVIEADPTTKRLKVDSNLSSISGTTVSEYAEDDPHTSGDKGVMALAVRQDSQVDFGADGDYVPLSIDANGSLRVNLSSISGTTVSEYAEDAVHTSGDFGVMALAVRQDSQVDFGADGDYVPLSINGSGELRVTSGSISGTTVSEYAEDAVHTSGDGGVMSLAVRNDTLAALAGTDGDYAPLQVDAEGAVYVNTGGEVIAYQDAIATSLATLDNIVSGNEAQVDVVASLPAGTNNIGDVDIASIAAGSNEIGVVIANLGATDNAVLDGINAKLTLQDAIATSLAILDNVVSGSEAQVDVVASLPAGNNNIGNVDIASAIPAGSNEIGVVISNLGATDNAVLDGINNKLILQDEIATSLATLDNIVSGSEAQVDVVTSALPTGAATAANQSTANTSLSNIDTSLNNIETDADTIAGAVSGSEMQVDIVTDQPLDRLADNIGVALQTDALMNDTTVLTPKYATISEASSGNNTLVGPVSGMDIKVLALSFVASTDIVVNIKDAEGGTSFTGEMSIAQNSGLVLPFNPVGWFATGANSTLIMSLSKSNTVSGSLVYVEA